MKADRCRSYKDIYLKMTNVLYFYILVVNFPSTQLAQDIFGYHLPGWVMRLNGFGTAIIGSLAFISLLLMLWGRRKEREKLEQIDLMHKKEKLFKECP